MLFIDKRNKIAPNIYIIDIGGYSFNAFEGLFVPFLIAPIKQPPLSSGWIIGAVLLFNGIIGTILV